MGHTFAPQWIYGLSSGDVGFANGSGIAGNGTSIPALNLFDAGGSTILNGFQLSNTFVPEPGTVAIAAIGAGATLLYRRKSALRGRAGLGSLA